MNLTPAKADAVSLKDVPTNFWGYANIQWGVNNQVVDGYQDETFKPNQVVEQAEFLAMLIRAFQPSDFKQESDPNNWSTPYKQYASKMGWHVVTPSSLGGHTSYIFLNRGMVAQLISNATGKNYSMDDSIQYLLDIRLAKGKTDTSIEGFKKGDEVTRAEAITFIQRLKQVVGKLQPSPSTEEKYVPQTSAEAAREQATKEKVAMRNLQNGGRVAVSGDWIFTNPSDQSPSLSKWSKDGSNKIKLSDDNAQSINIVGDLLYYTVQSDSGIYKMRQNGTERIKVSSVSSSKIVVNQNWIYYLDMNDAGINRMKLDGTEINNVISEKGINNFFINDNQLYFQNETNELFRAELSGSVKKKINENISKSFIIEDGWSYYVKGQNLYKSSLDGTTTILLHSVDPMLDNGPLYDSLQYRDEWIYFLHGRVGFSSSIYIEKIRIDGTGHTRVAHARYGMQLYDADPFFYVWTNALNTTEMKIELANNL